ncbi:MAG: hypothetical protein ACOC53_06925 [Candidatus Saliniplasma sp.]
MAILVVAALLLAPAIASAQYSDEITDSTNDVDHYQWTDTGYSVDEDVTRDNIDIVRVSIDESGGDITAELEVKGSILSDEETESHMWYMISMEDGDGDSYEIYYYFGQVYIEWEDGMEYDFTTPSGFGTSTLRIEFSLDTINNPDSLELTDAETYEYTESEGTGEYYMDEAEPGADDTNGDGTNGDGTNGDGTNGNDTDGDIDYDEGVIDDILARGMMCLALAIILPIIILIIIIVVVVKLLKKDDKGGEQPPQQQYQQPPPPSGPSQQQQQGQSGHRETPPPPPEDLNKE